MIERKHWHPDLTDEVIFGAAERAGLDLDDPGFCISCGHEQGGCEPDARRIKCESCGVRHVYGAAELVMHLDLDSDQFSRLWHAGTADGD